VFLEEKIDNKSALVGVIGLGYVGLPLAAAFHHAGFSVLGFDVDVSKIKMLADGRLYLSHLGETADALLTSERFSATGDMARLSEADAIFICVPTPLDSHLAPDLSFVESTAVNIAKTLRKQQLVVLESTTYPGTTREVLQQRLEEGGLLCGKDFFLAFSPEREDPGRKDFSTRTIPKLVGGVDAKSGRLATKLYEHAIERVIQVDSAEVAEGAKLLENIYRAVNIAMVNEMKVVFGEMGINIWDVIDAAATKLGPQRCLASEGGSSASR
jgi:UDP-N-acetyl-D-glucosamine dehydrogenase